MNWKKLIKDFRTDSQSLGFCLARRQLTMVHVRKYFRGMDLSHLISWNIAENGLADLKSKVSEVIAELGLQGLPASLTVNRGSAFIKHIKLPLAAMENLTQVVSYELDRFIPVAPEQVWFSFQVDQKTETEVFLNLFAVPKKQVEECLELLNAAGLKPTAVELAPVSSANAFALLGGRRLPPSWLLLAIGGDAVDLYQIAKDKLRPARHRTLAPKDEIWPEISNVFDHFSENGSPAGVLCLTGAVTAPTIGEALHTRYKFSILEDAELLARKFSPDLPLTDSVWPALGTSLTGVRKVPITCNLLPAEARQVIPLSNVRLLKILLATLAILGVIWLGSIYFHERVALFQVDRKIDSLTADVEKIKQQRSETQAITRQLQDLYGGKGAVATKLQILAILTQSIPDHTWLYSLRLGSKQVEISGMSKSAADLIQLLDKTGLFSKTQFSSPIVNDASGNENFTIQAELKEVD